MAEVQKKNQEKPVACEKPKEKHVILLKLPALASPKQANVEKKEQEKPQVGDEKKNLDSSGAESDNIIEKKKKKDIYFGCIAPLRPDIIDIHAKKKSEIQDLTYCCGVYFESDGTVVVNPILSIEFLTSIKSMPQSPRKSHCVIFVPGALMNADNPQAAEYLMNECVLFCQSLPYYPVLPFIWPTQSTIASKDKKSEKQKMCGEKLATFARRLWSFFEQIDFVGHGRGCQLIMDCIIKLKKEKLDVIDKSQLVFISPDCTVPDMKNFVKEHRDVVKRITMYCNTSDWKLFASKMLNWSHDRAGSTIMTMKGLDCVDTTHLLADFFSFNHYYIQAFELKEDISELLSEDGGGVEPSKRAHVRKKYLNSHKKDETESYWKLKKSKEEKMKEKPQK